MWKRKQKEERKLIAHVCQVVEITAEHAARDGREAVVVQAPVKADIWN